MSSIHTACVLCHSSEIALKYVIKGFHLVQCRRCRLIFVQERLSVEDLRTFYEKEDDLTYDETGQNTENLNFYYQQLIHLIRQKRSAGRLLDVGCSSGFFLDCLSGWECHGIEIDSRYAKKAQVKYGNRIHIGTLDDYHGEKGYFDVVTLQDVLDHLPEPLKALEQCYALLKSTGLLVVKVHDVSCLFAKVMGPRFYAFIPPVHLTYFNRTNLAQALSLSGFQVFDYYYISQQIFFKTIFYRLSQNNKRSLFYSLCRILDRLPMKNLKVRKNLHDIITMFAVKK